MEIDSIDLAPIQTEGRPLQYVAQVRFCPRHAAVDALVAALAAIVADAMWENGPQIFAVYPEPIDAARRLLTDLEKP